VNGGGDDGEEEEGTNMTPVPRLIAAQDPFRTHKLFYYMHITSK
jgi:hypothetical protein